MSDFKQFKIALVQMDCSDDGDINISNALSKIQEASKNGANVVCLPELFKHRYFCQTEDPDNFDLAEQIPGSTTDKFSELAKKLKVVIIVPLFEKRASGIYHNSLVTIDSDGQIVVGGVRSGKSRYAEELTQQYSNKKTILTPEIHETIPIQLNEALIFLIFVFPK